MDKPLFSRVALAVLISALCLPFIAHAIDLVDPFGAPVSATGYVSLSNVPQGGTAQVALGITTRSPWHINANLVNEDFLVPTEVHFYPPAGISVRGVVYPQGIEKKLGFSDHEALAKGMQVKAVEFVQKGAEIYSKA